MLADERRVGSHIAQGFAHCAGVQRYGWSFGPLRVANLDDSSRSSHAMTMIVMHGAMTMGQELKSVLLSTQLVVSMIVVALRCAGES